MRFPRAQEVEGAIGVMRFPRAQEVEGAIGVMRFPRALRVEGAIDAIFLLSFALGFRFLQVLQLSQLIL